VEQSGDFPSNVRRSTKVGKRTYDPFSFARVVIVSSSFSARNTPASCDVVDAVDESSNIVSVCSSGSKDQSMLDRDFVFR
jgi:hypothetical protein